jgi:hypothetical protein
MPSATLKANIDRLTRSTGTEYDLNLSSARR